MPGLLDMNVERVNGDKGGRKFLGITSVSRLEEENEEKLLEGMCKEYGSTAGAAACNLSCNRSLMLIICSPSGQPLDVS